MIADYILGISIAMLAFSAPLTARMLIVGRNRNGKYYVTTREYDAFKDDLGDRLAGLELTVTDLNNFVRSRL